MCQANPGHFNRIWDRLSLPRSCRQIWSETAKSYFAAAIYDLRHLKVTVQDMFDVPDSLSHMQSWELKFIESVFTAYDYEGRRKVDQWRPSSWHHLPALREVTILIPPSHWKTWFTLECKALRWNSKQDIAVTVTDGTRSETYGPWDSDEYSANWFRLA